MIAAKTWVVTTIRNSVNDGKRDEWIVALSNKKI